MADQNDFQQLLRVLTERMDAQEQQQRITNDLLMRLVTQQQTIFEWQQDINQRQEEFNQRQDEFNILFLEEIREMKKELVSPKEDTLALKVAVFIKLEDSLRRLEDFMNSLQNAA